MTLQEVVQPATIAQPSHSHTVIALWVLVALAIIEAAIIWITVKARGGWTYIATIPFVNLRQLVSLVLAVVTVIGTGLVGYFSGVWPPEHVYEGALIAISAWMSIDVAQYWVKRKTTDSTIPSTQNVMAAQAAAGVQVDARVARDATAPTARQPIPGKTAEMPTPIVVPVPATDAASVAPRPDLGVPDKGVL